jgi:GT2 family glycosyltransferase
MLRLTVVVCTYSSNMLPYLLKAVDSAVVQSYPEIEIVVVVDGNQSVYKSVISHKAERWSKMPPKRDIKVVMHPTNKGLSYSRNRGVSEATGDVIAFLDDDAVADSMWASKLMEAYQARDAISVGGPIFPNWEVAQPAFLPEELFWLIGAAYFKDEKEPKEVRNTFGSNMSFRKEVFKEIGGFDDRVGRKGHALLQGEETEFASRMTGKFGKKVLYIPDAKVFHAIFKQRVAISTLFRRSFKQGQSKRMIRGIAKEIGYDTQSDVDYLYDLGSEVIPSRIKRILQLKDVGKESQQLFFLVFCLALIAAGYVFSPRLR